MSEMAINRQPEKRHPRWALHLLHVVYYLVMIAFIVFYMLPFWGTHHVAQGRQRGDDLQPRGLAGTGDV